MMLYHVTKALNPLYTKYWKMRLSGEGKSYIPEDGPLILAMNHVSYLDPWYVGSNFPREIQFLINRRWYDRSPFWRWFFRSCGALPVTHDAKDTISTLNHVLAEGKVIGIFPEGAISTSGNVQRFKPGLALLASQSGAPVMPVGIKGARESLPLQSRWPKPGPIELSVGKPLKFPGSPWRNQPPPRRTVFNFLNRVRGKISKLSGQPISD